MDLAAAHSERVEHLLSRWRAGKMLPPPLIKELRAGLGGLLPGESAPPVERAAPLPPVELPRAPRYVLPQIVRAIDRTVHPWLAGLMARAFAVRSRVSVGRWAEDNHLKIPADESSGAPGDYREKTEPVATVVHLFLQDDRYKTFIAPKPSRMGYTLAANVGVCWWLKHQASNVIFCMDVKGKAERTARLRIVGMIKSLKALKDLVPRDPRRFTRSAVYLEGKTLFIAGSKSISDVTSDAAGLVIGDEADAYREFKGGEASAFNHLKDRIMDVPGGKAIFFGKPRNENDMLWSEMLCGTRHQCFVPCPHCGFMQPLLFDNMTFEHCKDGASGVYDLARVERETHFLCANPACRDSPARGIIEEKDKRAIVERHEWRQTYFGNDPAFPLDPKTFSVVPAGQVYSLRSELTWGNIAKEFLKARASGGMALAHYFRTRWGQARSIGESVTKLEDVRALQNYAPPEALRGWWESGERTDFSKVVRAPYQHGSAPWVPDDVVMFCDCQTESGEKKWVKMAARALPCGSVETAVVDYGIVMSFSQLLPLADLPLVVPEAAWGVVDPADRWETCCSSVWIDEGGSERNEISVREFCARPETVGRFFPSKGAGGNQLQGTVEERSRVVNTSTGAVNIAAYHFNHDSFATAFVVERVKRHAQILLAIAQGLDLGALGLSAPLWFPAFADEEFLKECCCLVLKKKRHRGRWVEVWEKTGDRKNDFQDGVQGCLAMLHFNSPSIAPPRADAPEDSAPVESSARTGRDYVLRR